jgi:DNA-directed RNA polymerase specialized sigma24 family protein
MRSSATQGSITRSRLKGAAATAASEGSSILAELKTSNRLLAVLATRGMEQKDAILLLDAVGFQPSQIAGVLAISPNAVRVSLYRLRKSLASSLSSGDEPAVTSNEPSHSS